MTIPHILIPSLVVNPNHAMFVNKKLVAIQAQ